MQAKVVSPLNHEPRHDGVCGGSACYSWSFVTWALQWKLESASRPGRFNPR